MHFLKPFLQRSRNDVIYLHKHKIILWSMKNDICTIIKCMIGAVWLLSACVVSGQAPAIQTSLTSVTTPQQPGTLIDGPSGLCPGAIQEYCMPEVAGAKYHWSISGDGSITNASDETCVRIAAANGCDGAFVLRVRVEAPTYDSVFEETVLVRDVTSPKVVCPKDITVSCDEQLPSVDVSAMVILESCNGTVVRKFVSGLVYDKTCINRYKLTRTYMATDACGNSATCTQHLEVNDGVSPNLYCPPNITVTCPDPALTPDPASTLAVDNCGGWLAKKHIGDVKTKQITADQYQLTRTYQTVDLCGQTGSCTQQIEVFDKEPPTIECPPALTVSCPGEVPAANPATVQVSDDCDLPVTTTHTGDVLSNQLCPGRYLLTRGYLVQDLCGHTALCSQSIAVNDQTPPSIACPPNTAVECADDALTVNLQVVTAGDNCGVVVSHVKDEVSGNTCDGSFVVVRTFKAEDACGASKTCTFKIQLSDPSIAPAVCPPDVTVSCPSEIPVFTPSGSGVSDHCGNPLPQVSWLGDLTTNKTCNNRYQLLRSYRATDACGFSGVCVQKISVDDQSGPALTCPADITVTCASLVPLASSDAVTAQDNCPGGNLTVSVDEVIGNQICPNRYQLARSYRAKDNCGNEGSCTQRITVDDTTPPGVTCPSDITVTCAELVPAANLNLVKSTEDCTGAVVKSFAGDQIFNEKCLNRFLLTRVYEATDLCANTGSCSQQILVADSKAPALTCPPGITVNSTSEAPPAATGSVSASTDNCNGAVTVSHVYDLKGSAACAERYNLIRVYQAADECGNSATCIQTIVVNDQTPPGGKCPEKITVSCAADIPCAPDDPAIQALVQQLQSAYADNSGVPVLVDVEELSAAQECTPDVNTFGRTIRFGIHDDCGNATSCTVALSGSCFCTRTQDFWGTPASKIGSLSVTQVLDSLLQSGWVTIGNNIGCGWTANSAPCILKALPGNGPSTPFRPDSLPTCSTQMKNTLAGQLVALELNIRYNQRFRNLDLGKQPLSGSCLMPAAQVNALKLPAPPTVKGLQNRANDYLLSFCNDSTYAPAYGEQLSAALAAVNGHWDNCQNNTVCPPSIDDPRAAEDRKQVADVAGDGLWLRPNPASTTLQVSFPLAANTEMRLNVFDTDGQLVYAKALPAQAGTNSAEIDVTGWAPGLYWLSLAGERGTMTKRFVVMRR